MNTPVDLLVAPLSEIQPVGAPGGNEWLAYGGDPSFACSWPGGAVLEGGWYAFEFEADVNRGSMHSPTLYPDYQRGHLVEAESIVIPLRNTGLGRHRIVRLVRLNQDVSALRFDPSVLPCGFTLIRLRITRLGRVEAARMMLAGLMQRRRGLGKLRLLAAAGRDLLLRGPRGMADRLYAEHSTPPRDAVSADYMVWLDFYDGAAEVQARAAALTHNLTATPLVSVIVPVFNTPERWLRACIDSVLAQAYPHWELCLADDASTAPHVRVVLQEYASRDRRIKLALRDVNGHISAASNSALEIADGTYVALLDHDDALHPLALLECVRAFQSHPRWRMLFTDEDKVDEAGVRSDPYFKSDWNPDLFLSQNCVCHLTLYERALVEEVGRFRVGYEGAQDWDLTLRVTERLEVDQIGHVPKMLYHWRMIEGSTALAPGEKTYAQTAGLRSIQDHFDRTGQAARIREMSGVSGYYKADYALPEPAPLVSLLVPTRDRVDLLQQCVESILRKTDYDNLEILILDNGSTEPATLAYFASLQDEARVRVLPYPHPFNYSAINNFGARHARGEVLGLLNNDVEAIDAEWLAEMVSHAMRPGVGVVGAMLYYPNDTIQHAGVILGIGGIAGHSYVGIPRGNPGDKHRAALTQSASAVTAACAIVRASVFNEVGGLDEQLAVAFNDVDFCMRVRAAGYRNVWTPFAQLYHHESASRGYENTPEKILRFKSEERFMHARWGRTLQEDPYYNPNLSLNTSAYALAFPPRPWGDPGIAP